MNNIEKAQKVLVESLGHVLIYGDTRTGKTKLLEETKIPDSKRFDFVKMCKSSIYPDLKFLCPENEEIYLNDILNVKETTVILDSVEFPQNLTDSFLYDFLKTMSVKGKRCIVVAASSSCSLENFKPLFDYEIETLKESDGALTCKVISHCIE